MQLTRAADYAVRVMIHLAGMAPGTRASRAELAEAAGCPEQFLSKVLQNLTKRGLVLSRRGNTGGFELPPAHRSATMLEIMEAVEGPVRLNQCLDPDHPCHRQSWCPGHTVWVKAQTAMFDVLRAARIDALAKQVTGVTNIEPAGAAPERDS